jgi:hypothetical protein
VIPDDFDLYDACRTIMTCKRRFSTPEQAVRAFKAIANLDNAEENDLANNLGVKNTPMHGLVILSGWCCRAFDYLLERDRPWNPVEFKELLARTKDAAEAYQGDTREAPIEFQLHYGALCIMGNIKGWARFLHEDM